MPTTRRSAATVDPNAPDITDTAAEDMPGVPGGVAADVTVRYKSTVREKPRTDYDSELDQLAAMTAGDDNPPDALCEFLETWANYVGYNCMVLRLPDASTRRAPGATYVRPHFGQPESLGAVTFDPNPLNFISSLQFINGNSGGCFQIWLMDHTGGRIQDAVLYSYAIGDPPRQPVSNTAAIQVQQPPPPQMSDSERRLEQVKDQLFTTALERALNPAAPASATGNLSPEDSASLFLLNKTDFLSSIFGKMADLAQHAASTQATTDPTWRDRAIDAGVEVIKTNPQIVERLSGVVERIIARVLPDPRFDGPPLLPQPYYQPPSQPAPPPWQQPRSEQPPAPAPAPSTPASEAPVDDEEDDEIMDTLDRLIVLINSNDPLTLDNPVILQLLKDYPMKARVALRLIASQPLDELVEWITATGGPLYESMLNGPASGPFLRQRLAEFKQVCEDAAAKVKATQTTPASATAPETET